MMISNKFLRPLIFCTLAFGLVSFPVQAESHEKTSERVKSIDSKFETKILVSGARFQGANGIRVVHKKLLYVTSVVGSRIDVLNARNGKLIRTYGPEQGVFGVDDLAFSPDGQLYWTAFLIGEVMRLNAEGQAELVEQVGPGVNAISFSDDGRLFVSRIFLADELYEIDPLGVQPKRLIMQGIGGLNAMDFSSDGYLYGPLWFKGQVVRIDVDTAELTVITRGLSEPASVKFSPSEELYVIDQLEGTLLKVDIETGSKKIVARPGVGSDNFDFDKRSYLYHQRP